MKKCKTLILIISFIMIISFFIIYNKKENYIDDNYYVQKNDSLLSMNLEQTAGAGDYKQVTQSSWPTEGYKFNAELSRCENGSTLSWDDTKKAIVISGNLSDKCYVYFDIAYILPSVTKVTPTTKYNQITVTTTGTKGTNEISKYYYSINNSSYVEGTSTYTFTNLNEQTTYNIKVKVADTNGRMSNEYSLSATTDAYKLPTIADVTTSSTLNSITINVSGKAGDGTITEYYYSKDNGSNYVKSTSSSYTFTNLTSDTTFYIKVYVKDSNGRNSIIYVTNAQTLFAVKLSNYVISQYTGTQGDNSLYYHNSSLANGAGDNSYRYAGASESVNNFVCLGSDAATCPDANLFRIIGVFGDKTKVIRAKSVGDQKWDSSNSNTWSSSSLNTYLNGTYLTSLGTLADKIATTTWKVGGGRSTYLYDVPKTAYQYEVGSSASSTTYDAKIGLMYVSDYGFTADQSGWTTKLSSYNSNTSKNWLFLGFTEWTISRYSNYTDYAFRVLATGAVYNRKVTDSIVVRPSFNLLSSVTYASGSGTSSDPIRIN